MVVPELHAVLPLDSRKVTVGHRTAAGDMECWLSCRGQGRQLQAGSQDVMPGGCAAPGWLQHKGNTVFSVYMCEVFVNADFLGTAAG